ncbi:MAG TPA: hypothetical protein VF629_24865 [Hymenobacter sp.]|jgi:hypothetical protein|uniref:hypothetical protein n=1 Tax=Hymenobacter sp. TaxID=1898978 RepID=UPI002EDBAA73
MRNTVLLLWAVLRAEACQAQANCDSLYKLANPFGGVPLVTRFEKPPEIITGKEHLLTYHVPKERVGEAYFQVLIDEQGAPLCLQWLKVTNALVQAEAAHVVSLLRFSPGVQNAKPIKVPMTLVVQFREGSAPTRKDLRRARRTQAL